MAAPYDLDPPLPTTSRTEINAYLQASLDQFDETALTRRIYRPPTEDLLQTIKGYWDS